MEYREQVQNKKDDIKLSNDMTSFIKSLEILNIQPKIDKDVKSLLQLIKNNGDGTADIWDLLEKFPNGDPYPSEDGRYIAVRKWHDVFDEIIENEEDILGKVYKDCMKDGIDGYSRIRILSCLCNLECQVLRKASEVLLSIEGCSDIELCQFYACDLRELLDEIRCCKSLYEISDYGLFETTIDS